MEKKRMTTEEIITAMVPAMVMAVDHAVAQHGGRLPPTLERAALICAEEAGELAGAVLEATRDTMITHDQFTALETRIIAENMDLLATAIIFIMVNSGAVPVSESSVEMAETEIVGFDIDPKMRVM